MDKFLKYWFQGFENAVMTLDEESKSRIFKECGKACAESYTKEIYLYAKSNAKNEEEFLELLRSAFPELTIEKKEGDSYLITYKYCACDLVQQDFVKSPHLCECSRQSLLYNWENIFGKDNVEVELLQSILQGDPCCKFYVKKK